MEDCPLCSWWDCDCEDILSPEEYKKLVNKEIKNNLVEASRLAKDLSLSTEEASNAVKSINRPILDEVLNKAKGANPHKEQISDTQGKEIL